jgi:hypothetical protein
MLTYADVCRLMSGWRCGSSTRQAGRSRSGAAPAPSGAHFTCFAGTKVRILTLTLWSGPCTVSKASSTHTLCARLVAVERARGGEACDEEVLSLLALLVQKCKFFQRLSAHARRQHHLYARRCSVYLLYWYKSANTDAVRALALVAAPAARRQDAGPGAVCAGDVC